MSIADIRLRQGEAHPFNGRAPTDDGERAALGVLADLCDRRGIKHELKDVDDDIREEIVTSLAAIIRKAFA